MTSAHEVRLVVPADLRHLATIRLTAAGVGTEAGLDLDEIDDVKIAVDELVTAVIKTTSVPAELTLAFDIGDGRLDVAARADWSATFEPDELVTTVVAATTDGASIEHGPNPGFAFHKIHRGA